MGSLCAKNVGRLIKATNMIQKSALKKIAQFLLVVLLLLSMPAPPSANAAVSDWYSDNWTYRKKLTIDNTKVDADLTNFPVLVSRTDTDLRDDAQDDNDDILFTSSDGVSKLDHEIESFDGATGALVAWVEVPSVANASDTVIYMYYGYGSAAAQSNATGVWDANYKGVWHMDEAMTDEATTGALDASNTSDTDNDLAQQGNDDITGKIGTGQTFDGTNDYVTDAYDADFDFGTGALTASGWFKSAGSAITTTVTSRVADSEDDGEENMTTSPAAATNINSSDLELPRDGSNEQQVYMRFRNVAIPQGAIITSSKITFQAAATASTSVTVLVAGHDIDEVPAICVETLEISERTDRTTATIAWTPAAWTAGSNYDTDSINSIVQELVDRSGWRNGNDMGFIIKRDASDAGTALRNADSYDGDSANAALLTVTYKEPQYLLSRYDTDQGFKVWMTSEGKIAYATDDDAIFEGDCQVTSSTATYDDDSWHYFTAVKTANTDNTLYVDGASAATISTLTSGCTGTTAARVLEEEDDAEQTSGGTMDLSSSDFDIQTNSDCSSQCGVRFGNVRIPQGATLTSTVMTMQSVTTESTTTPDFTFYAENVDNAAIFTSAASNLSGRAHTTDSTVWTNVGAWTAETDFNTPDISSPVQEVINRAGWAIGNSLAIFFSSNATTAKRTHAHRKEPESAARLSISYKHAEQGTLTSDSAPLSFGSEEPTNAKYLDGEMDELRMSNTARASGWISTEYNSQNSPSTFYSTGSEETQVTFNQSAFRFFANANSADVGSALAAADTAATLSAAGDAFRLRVAIHIANNTLLASGETLKLQYVGKGGGTCASPSGGSPASYTDVTTLTDIAYKDNAAVADDATLTDNANDPAHSGHTNVNQTYNEANNFTNSVASVAAGEDMLFDFALYDKAQASSRAYCFRIVESGDTVLDTYDVYPQITTASSAGPSLSFSISDNSIGFGTLSPSAARYASGDATGSASETTAHTLSAATNATSGYTITVNGATLTHTTNGSYTITAIGSSNTASSAGSEQFGLRLAVNSGNGTVTAPYAAAGFALDTAAFPDQVASGTGDGSTTEFSVRYLANISSSTDPGSYSATLTFLAIGNF